MHQGLRLSINNFYEHLELRKFDLGSINGTSSFDVSFFKSSSADKAGCL